MTTFHADPAARFETAMAAREKATGEPPRPNGTGVGAHWPAGFDFEIKVVARIPAQEAGSR